MNLVIYLSIVLFLMYIAFLVKQIHMKIDRMDDYFREKFKDIHHEFYTLTQYIDKTAKNITTYETSIRDELSVRMNNIMDSLPKKKKSKKSTEEIEDARDE